MKGFRFQPLLMAILFIITILLFFKYALPSLISVSLLAQCLTISIIVVILIFFSYDKDVYNHFNKSIATITQKDEAWPIRWFFLFAIPAIVACTVFILLKPNFDSPVELRQVHPAPPSNLNFFNKTYDLTKLENPVREEIISNMRAGDKEKGWEIYEVKSSTSVKQVNIQDAAIQYYALQGCGLDISKTSIVHINNQ